jgi:hypothetical protein
LEALNKWRFLGPFGPMITFKRVRTYKSVHKPKLRFPLTVEVSEALVPSLPAVSGSVLPLWKKIN